MNGKTAMLALALALTLGAGELAAQAWRGTAAVEVEVSDRGRRPVAGAQVVLEFVEIEPKAGPPAVATDATGTAAVYGLAEGRWLLEVRYQETRPYSAILEVEAGRRAVVVAGPVRDAAAPPLNVKFVKAQSKPSAPLTQPPPPPADEAAEPTLAREPAPTRELSPPVPEPPAPEPAPPAEARAEPEPALEEPAPAPPTVDVPTTPEPEAALEPPTPGAAPTNAESPAAEPAPAPPAAVPELAPAPAPPPLPTPLLRSAAAGNCPECGAGEWAVSTELAAAPARGGDCQAEAAAREAIQLLTQGAEEGFRGYAGPLLDPATGRVAAIATPQARAGAEGLLAPYATPGAPCQLLVVVLPRGARYRGYGYQASDATTSGPCVGDEECEIGQAHWASHPVIERTPEGTLLFAVFHNTSPDRERRARLTVYLTPAGP